MSFLVTVLWLFAAPLTADNAAGKVTSVTILFFTASWCEPCRAVYPVLDEFARQNPKQLKLVLVDYDRAADEVARWEVHEIPVVIVLSKEGTLLLRSQGGDRETLRALKSALRALLRNPRKRSHT